MIKILFSVLITVLINNSNICYADKILHCVSVSKSPVINGNSDDKSWSLAQFIKITDKTDPEHIVEIRIKSVHNTEKIFFLVTFPDPDESRLHKEWIWNESKQMYVMGPHREDTFIFKWSMETGAETTDLSVHAERGYLADIWFWKAHRTDPTGYADDKTHILTTTHDERAKKIITDSGKTKYLRRHGDMGTPPYKSVIPFDYQGKTLPQYKYIKPEKSRADVRAKGVWKAGVWSIEFSRNLITGYDDDVQFSIGDSFLFGVSIYEIAGRTPDYNTTQPFYGCGDVRENIILKIEP